MNTKIDNRFHKLEVAMKQAQADINNLAKLLEMSKQAIIKLENEREQPSLKKLDQSIFNDADEFWRFAATDENGNTWLYREPPYINTDDSRWVQSNCTPTRVDGGYDSSDWQNSLIEREPKELTGSDLCRAMLERGDKIVLCAVKNHEDELDSYDAVIAVSSNGKYYESTSNLWSFAAPINNKGEPLTQAEVGL